MLKFFTLMALLAVFLFPSAGFSAGDLSLPEITADNFDAVYETVVGEFSKINANVTDGLKKKFRAAKGSRHKKFSKKEARLKKEYEFYLAHKRELDPVYELKQELKNLYLEFHSVLPEEQEALNKEAALLAMDLIEQTKILRKKYKSFFIPIVHNMMLDVGLRKRGACKHWAEDLLNHLHTVERRFFSITWGESHAGEFTEHNVAVLIPRGRKFEDGLLFDPWRTSGNPFWVRVTDDRHFQWTQWADYGRF